MCLVYLFSCARIHNTQLSGSLLDILSDSLMQGET